MDKSESRTPFHDWFGYLEVIPAMLLIWGLMALLGALFIEPTTEGPLVFAEGGGYFPAKGAGIAGGDLMA